MLPFCGYDMGDYFAHWLAIGKHEGAKLPKVFYVNWFRKDADGKFLWPGFGENSRVLAWVFERCNGQAEAEKTAIGYVPGPGALHTDGLDLSADQIAQLLEVDADAWKAQLPQVKEHFARFGETMPPELHQQLAALEERLEQQG